MGWMRAPFCIFA